MTLSKCSISHLELNVSQYAHSVRFYNLILLPLGWDRVVCQQTHTTYSEGSMKIVISPVEDKFEQFGFHRKRIGLNHLAFYAKSKSFVDEYYNSVLLKNGIPCLYGKQPYGESDYYAVYFEDPDRIKLELVYSPLYCSPKHWTNTLGDDFTPYI